MNTHCWSPTQNSYTFYPGTEMLDASTLLAAANGFDRGERLAGTIAAIRRELADGPLVYRYTGMRAEEGAFIACSFWLVSALTHPGSRQEAVGHDGRSRSRWSNDVGLLAEQMPLRNADARQLPAGPQSPRVDQRGHSLAATTNRD